jgi:biopolymer transport protein ExbB
MGAAQSASAGAPQEVMAAIAEALVATAVGLAVAIPAVAAYNFYQRHTRAVLGNTDALSNVLLAHLSGLDNGNGHGKRAAGEDD